MIKKISNPSIIHAAGVPPKRIEEYIGRVNTGNSNVSIARMISPCGWQEPGQTPEFDEYTVVLKGVLHIRLKEETLEVNAGEAVIIPKGTWVQYSSPFGDGAEYMAICLPAFSPDTVHRDE